MNDEDDSYTFKKNNLLIKESALHPDDINIQEMTNDTHNYNDNNINNNDINNNFNHSECSLKDY
jgi:hypothetical protein